MHGHKVVVAGLNRPEWLPVAINTSLCLDMFDLRLPRVN